MLKRLFRWPDRPSTHKVVAGRRSTKRRRARRLAAEKLEPRTLLTAVSWDGGGDGLHWSDRFNWSGDALPGATDDVTIDLGTNAVQHHTGTTTVQSLTTANPFSITGGTLTIANTLQVNGSFTLNGGTLAGGTATFAAGKSIAATSNASNRLLDVTVHGDLSLSAFSAVLRIEGTTTFDNAHLSGQDSNIKFSDGHVLTGNVLLEGSAGSNRSVSVLGTSGTLTIGPTGSIRTVSGFAGRGLIGAAPSLSGTMTLINQGTISSAATGRLLEIFAASLDNRGTVISSAGTVNVQNGLTSSGIIEATGTGIVSLLDTWSNTGSLRATGGTLNLGGSFSTSDVNRPTFQRSGGIVNVTGTLDNSGDTLLLDTVTGSWTIHGGSVVGGTVQFANGVTLSATVNPNNALVDVQVEGDVQLPSTGSTLRIEGTTTFDNAHLSGQDSNIKFSDGHVLTGNLLLEGSAGSNRSVSVLGTSGTLTIGPTGSIRTVSGFAGRGLIGVAPALSGTMTLINQGTISSAATGRLLEIFAASLDNRGTVISSAGTVNVQNGLTSSGIIEATGTGNVSLLDTWSNTGSLRATGGTLNLGGSFSTADVNRPTFQRSGGTVNVTGTLDNSGDHLLLDTVTGNWTIHGGSIIGGTVQLADGVALSATANPNNALVDARVEGDVQLPLTGSTLRIEGTTTFDNAHLSGQDSNLKFSDGHVLTGNVLLEGSAVSNRSVSVLGTSGTLTIGPTGSIRTVTGFAGRGLIGAAPTLSGTMTLINQGTISSTVTSRRLEILAAGLDNRGTVISSAGTVNVHNSLTSSGIIEATGTGIVSLLGTWSNTGSLRATGGTFDLGGNFSTSDVNRSAFQRSGGAVNITGVVNNAGQTMLIDGVTGSITLSGGTISGGIVVPANGHKLSMSTHRENRLVNATVEGDLDLSLPDASLQIEGSTSFNNAHLIGSESAIGFAPGSVLTGNVLFEGGSGNRFVEMNGQSGTLTIGPTGSIRSLNGFTGTGIVGLSNHYAGNMTLLNDGVISAEAPARRLVVMPASLAFAGDMRSSSGGTLELRSVLRLDGATSLVSDPSSTIEIKNHLLGDTLIPRQLQADGTLRLAGAGTASDPQKLEVLSQDLGMDEFGFHDNFALGTLTLISNEHVKLVDESNNSAGDEPEALYVNTLNVPTGATLDLQGLNVYARAARIDGTVLGGVVTRVPDSGPLAFTLSTPGTIGVAGQLDEWQFFGRSDQRVGIFVVPGGSGPLAPVDPQLAFAHVTLLDAAGNILRDASNVVGDAAIELSDVPLSADGIYRVLVQASAGHTGNTGGYTISLYDMTADEQPLTLGQKVTGKIESLFTVDHWNFAATAGQQLKFDLVSTATPAIVYDLTGPGGISLFTGQVGDSEPINVGTSGEYRLTARALNGATGSYTFRLVENSVALLTPGTPQNGSLAGTGSAYLFRVDVPGDKVLTVTLDDSRATDRVELYARFGSPPSRTVFDYKAAKPGQADQSLTVPQSLAGSWYFLVYAAHAPRINTSDIVPFTFTAAVSDITVTGLMPESYAAGETLMLAVLGGGFKAGALVELVADDGTPYAASAVTVDSSARLSAQFDLGTVPEGLYDVRVTRTDGTSMVLPNGFLVAPASAPRLEAKVEQVGVGVRAPRAFHVEYANTGTAAMLAPILILRTTDPDGSDRPRFTLDKSLLTTGIWSPPRDGEFNDSVQIVASGSVPGLLSPGERIQVPVYYAGVELPWSGDRDIELELVAVESQNDVLIDWPSQQLELQPDWIPDDAWPAVFANLRALVGETYGALTENLGRNAGYLERLGLRVVDLAELFSFLGHQANGLDPVGDLAAAVDAAVPGTGIPLTFGRAYGNTIASRYALGPFGRGWKSSWDTRLILQSDGTAIVSDSPESQRVFRPDTRREGNYFSQAGDTGVMKRLSNGRFELTEVDGTKTQFQPDGRLDFVQDVNGNRVTAGYIAGQLTSLTHSAGQSLTIGYNGAGRITSITESTGRVIQYAYDASNEHLISVTSPVGTTSYTYASNLGPARQHALLSVIGPDGLARHYDYDDWGRLIESHVDGDQEAVQFHYEPFGKVTQIDGAGLTTSSYFDHRGLVSRVEDGAGKFVQFQFNEARQLTRLVDSLGRSTTYTRCPCGMPKSITDPLGRTTIALTLDGPRNLPTALADANGNVTRYTYDELGNLLRTTLPNGTTEQATYNNVGDPLRTTDRSGQTADRTYDAQGRLTRIERSDGTFSEFTFDDRHRLLTATDARGTTSFVYDAADRLTRVDYPNGRWLRYEYDAAGRRIRLEDHSGFVELYEYDNVGRLARLREASGTALVEYTYDVAGRLVREDKGNGTATTYGYDSLGRNTSIVHLAPDGAINSQFIYTFDAAERIATSTSADGTWAYHYDLIDQLVRAEFASSNPDILNQDLYYEYDALGNRVRTVLNGATTVYASNNMNQYVTAGDTSYQYDLNGNLVREIGPAGERRYTYDSFDQLVRLETPEGSWEYEYDLFGNRTAVIANGDRTEYLVDPLGLGDVVGEYDENGLRVNGFANGLGLIGMATTGGWSFYDFDATGSTAGLSDSTGDYLNRYAYDPTGRVLREVETAPNAFEFVGQLGVMSEENGLNFMRARYYEVELGRFTSPDPLRLGGGDVNLYRYVDNSPIDYVDPAGTEKFKIRAVKGLEGNTGQTVIFGDDGIVLYDPGKPGKKNRDAAIDNVCNQVTERMYPLLKRPEKAIASKADCLEGLGYSDKDFIKEVYKTALDLSLKRPAPQPRVIPYAPYRPPGPDFSKLEVLVPVAQGLLPLALAKMRILVSTDPNEKYGADGFGPEQFITADTTIPYEIHFENLGAGSVPRPARPATAPAQRVDVTDRLSPLLDWDTVEFTEFGFGDTRIEIPSGQSYHFESVPLTYNGQSFVVDVEFDFNRETGELRAAFQSVDPLTELPPDVSTGFLPPENGTGIGKGFLSFRARPRAGLASGTTLRNIALIQFDGQTVIATNQVDPQNPARGTDPAREAVNTIDALPPMSCVTPLPVSTNANEFVVQWSGEDDALGSGIRSYDVYVSVDGGPFVVWLANTADTMATYSGSFGHTYSFYSLAIDNVGHIESGTKTGEATTTLLRGLPSISVTPITGLVTTEAGGTATFQISLSIPPLADVTVRLISGNPSEGQVPESIVFTRDNWSTPQTVTVTGQDDTTVDGDVAYTIQTSVLSQDAEYAAIDPDDVSVVNRNDDAPQVQAVITNDGQAQRSRVTKLVVTFNGLVTWDDNSFVVRRTSNNQLIHWIASESQVAGRTVVTLTFSGAGTEYGSLADGNYQLIVRAGQVRAGELAVLNSDRVDHVFRLLGDSDGDRDVDNVDFLRFRSANGKRRGESGFLDYFDVDDDGVIGTLDQTAFMSRKGTRLN